MAQQPIEAPQTACESQKSQTQQTSQNKSIIVLSLGNSSTTIKLHPNESGELLLTRMRGKMQNLLGLSDVHFKLNGSNDKQLMQSLKGSLITKDNINNIKFGFNYFMDVVLINTIVEHFSIF